MSDLLQNKINQTLNKIILDHKPLSENPTPFEQKTAKTERILTTYLNGLKYKIELKNLSRWQKVRLVINNLYNWMYYKCLLYIPGYKGYAQKVLNHSKLFNSVKLNE